MLSRTLACALSILTAAGLTASPLLAQSSHPSAFTPALAERPPVREALRWLETSFDRQVEEWIRITEIPAPSTKEQRRAEYVRTALSKDGIDATIDEVSNVIVRWPGTGGGPTIVFAAHTDTVHPLETDVTVRREGDILRAPGIFDNSASVANMMAILRALKHANVRTRGDLIFIATVQEEAGFRGISHWLDQHPGVAGMVVAMDGGLGGVSYGALWTYGTRYIFRGEGAHTMTSRGKPHPARALADAISSIYEIKIPDDRGFAVFNVGMLQGGKVRNAIPQEVWFTVDLRAVDMGVRDALDARIEACVASAAKAHGVEWAKDPPTRPAVEIKMLPQETRRAHPVVQTALDVYQYLGIPTEAQDSGSTDANAAVRRGIPAIAVGRGRGSNQHTLSERAEISGALPATKAVLLIGVSLAGLDGGSR